MQIIQQTLEASLEDFAISRSERNELKTLLATIQGNKTEQAKVRQLAFRLATKAIEEVGELTAMNWLEGIIKLLYSNEMKIKASAYFSPGDDCLHRIRRMISEAQQSLDICIFTLTDNRIVEKLLEAYHKGVRIRIISDNLKSEDLGSDMDRLERYGISCRYDKTSAHMHHKFAIADGTLLLTGSYNWTRSASTENNENIIVSDNGRLMNAFQDEFNRLWKALV
jgi:cardiolipin hydrolase